MNFQIVFQQLHMFILSYIFSGHVLSVIKIRKNLEAKEKSEQSNEVQLLAFHMINVFGGGMVANLLSGLSPISTIQPTFVISALLAWLLVFYGPDEYIYNHISKPEFKIYFKVMNELRRCFMVFEGVVFASNYVDTKAVGILLISCIALIRGHGAAMFWDRFKISMNTKLCFVVSVIFTLVLVVIPNYTLAAFCTVTMIMIAIRIALEMIAEKSKFEKAVTWIAGATLILVLSNVIYTQVIDTIM